MEHISQPSTLPQSNTAGASNTGPLIIVTILFFMWGLLTSLNDVLIPHLKALYTLTYVQAMLVQFCFFGAYFIVSLPAGMLIKKIGYQNGAVTGLTIAAAGCALFYPASNSGYCAVPARLLRAGRRHHHPAGGGQPVRHRAGRPADRIEPPDADPGLQFARHHRGAGARRLPDPVGQRAVGDRTGSAAGKRSRSPTAQPQAASVQGPYLALAGALLVLALAVRVRPPAEDQPHR